MHTEEEYETIEKALGIRFNDRKKLTGALSHSSYVYEKGMPYSAGNERLEFLGDSIVGMVVSEHIFGNYPDQPEGKLSKIKSVVVSKKILARAAQRLGLGSHVLLGRGEDLTGGRQRRSLLANVFEGIVGAIYLDQGLAVAREFVLRNLKDEVEPAALGRSIRDHKSELQEIAQRRLGQVPRYRVTDVAGPDHDRVFEVEVHVDNHVVGLGAGRSKKSAEQKAAEAAIRKLRALMAREEARVKEEGANGSYEW
jgi:ribonuclease-3